MKILLVSSLYGRSGGGAGIVAQALAKGIASHRNEVVVVTTGLTSRIMIEFHDGIKVYSFLPRNLYPIQDKNKHPNWQKIIWQCMDIDNPFTARILRDILLKERPDVIHIHKMRGLSGAVWSVSTQMCPSRVIQTCHDFESMSPEGLLQGRIGRWAHDGKWPIRWYQLARARLSRNISWVTAPSAFTLTTIAKSGLFSSSQYKLVPNSHGWTALDLQTIRSNAKRSDPLHMLFLGRLEPEKGLRELCLAITSLTPKYPGLRLTIGGWGSLESELILAHGSNPNITIAGEVFGEEKNQLLSSASVMIVPSTCPESFGMVVAEAYAYGKPVIASRLGALPELVREGETGWLVEPASVEALARGIETAIQNPGLLARMSPACYRAAQAFTIEKMVRDYEELYLDVLKGS